MITFVLVLGVLQKQPIWEAQILLPKQAPSPGVFLYYRSTCLLPGVRNCGCQCQNLVERNYLLKSYTGLD